MPERATITNMGAELGATTSIFPCDESTRAFLKAQGREEAWIRPSRPTRTPSYDEVIEIDLDSSSRWSPSPTARTTWSRSREARGQPPCNQVCVGTCTNSSYRDLMVVAADPQGQDDAPDVSA